MKITLRTLIHGLVLNYSKHATDRDHPLSGVTSHLGHSLLLSLVFYERFQCYLMTILEAMEVEKFPTRRDAVVLQKKLSIDQWKFSKNRVMNGFENIDENSHRSAKRQRPLENWMKVSS